MQDIITNGGGVMEMKPFFKKVAFGIGVIYKVLNCVLTLIALCFLCVILIEQLRSRHYYRGNEKSVSKNLKEKIEEYKKNPDEDELIFSDRNGEVDVFKVMNNTIKKASAKASTTLVIGKSIGKGESSNLYYGTYNDVYDNKFPKSVVNLIFNKNNGESEVKLFSENVFFYDYSLVPSPISVKTRRDAYESLYGNTIDDVPFISNIESTNTTSYCEKSLYFIIDDDTNGDDVLNIDDNVSFYVSDYDGTNLKKLSSNTYMFNKVDATTVMYSDSDGDGINVYSFDYKTNEATLIRRDNGKHIIKNLSLGSASNSQKYIY